MFVSYGRLVGQITALFWLRWRLFAFYIIFSILVIWIAILNGQSAIMR